MSSDVIQVVSPPAPEVIQVVSPLAPEIIYVTENETVQVVSPLPPEVIYVTDSGESETVQVVEAGPQGPAGPTGLAGASGSSYRHVQSSPAASWVITHGLSKRPAVTLVLDGDTQAVYTDVFYPDLNSVSLQFPAPAAGIAEM